MIEILVEDINEKKSYPGKGWVLGTKDEPKNLKDKDIIWRSKVHHWDNDVRSNNTRFIIVKSKGKFDMWAKSDKSGKIVFHFGTKPTLDAAKEFASIRKWQQKEEVEIDEALSRKDQLKLALAKSKFKKSGGKIEVQPPSPATGSKKYRGVYIASPKTKEDEKMAQDIQKYRKKMGKKQRYFPQGKSLSSLNLKKR